MLRVLLSVFGLTVLFSVSVFAQADNGASESKPQMYVDFYKLPPGQQDEWLALYKKYHYPIMRYQLEHGQMVSETIYTRSVHELSPSWDIAIVLVLPPAGQRKKPELTRAQMIRKLFPDIDDYVKGEQRRWALTLAQWAEIWTELDIERNPSLYYPSPE
jgi:hypothetical protein